MRRQDAEELSRTIGMHVGASWRQIALGKRLGVPKALGVSLEHWVNETLGGFVKLAVDDRRSAEGELKAEGLSNREIARVLGVDESTVREDLRAGNPAVTPIENQELAQKSAGNPALTEQEVDLLAGGPFGEVASMSLADIQRALTDQLRIIEAIATRFQQTHSAVTADLLTVALAGQVWSIGAVIKSAAHRDAIDMSRLWAMQPDAMAVIMELIEA